MLRWEPIAVSAFVLLLGLLTTLAVAHVFMEQEHTAAGERFEERARQVSRSIQEVMTGYEQVLKAGAGLFEASNVVERHEWATFVSSLELEKQFPGIQGLGYAEVIQPGNLAEHISKQRANGRPQYQHRPEGERSLYTAIVFLEPEDWRNARAIGYDMYSHPVRRAAMDRAAEEGKPALTGKVILVQETEKDVQAGTLMYLPVYKAATEPSSSASETRLQGYIYAVFRMTDLLQTIFESRLSEIGGDITVQLFDGETYSKDSLLHSSDQSPNVQNLGDFSHDETIEVGLRHWSIRSASTPVFDVGVDHVRSNMMLVLGTIISGLLAGAAYILSNSRGQARADAARLAEEVARRTDAQQEVTIANKELLHRVKNTLAVVHGIMKLTQAGSPDPATFAERFEARLQSLSHSHELLVSGGWFGVSLSEVVETQTNALGCQQQVIAGGPRLKLNPQATQNLGLALHELCTNSIKHGALSAAGGKAEVRWSVSEDESQCQLIWAEELSHQRPKQAHRGFGHSLLTRIVPTYLAGAATLEFSDTKLRWVLDFPLQPNTVSTSPGQSGGQA